jgi:hypothetical protein
MKITDLDKNILEGHFRRPGSPHAYDRDVRASQSGMGHKDSLAYQQDGGANDEGWDKEPYQHHSDKPVLKGYYFYDVPAGMEGEAAIYGVKKTKNGKWAKALYSTSGRSYALQKNGADKAFGPGKFWSPKKESIAETATAGATSAGNVGVGAVYPNKPPKQPKKKDGTAKNALDMDANLLTGGSIKR